MKKSIVLGGLILTAGMISCETKTDSDSPTEVTAKEQTSIKLDYIDKDTRPQDDFFQFCNGKWLAEAKIPDSESSWGSFNELDKTNKEKLKTILETAASSKSEKGSTNQLVGDYYKAFMDSTARNEAGIAPIQAELDLVKNMASKEEISKVILDQHLNGIGSLFGIGVGQDMMDVKTNTIYASQGGLGLSKDYYFKDIHADVKVKYEAHIARMLTMIGEENTEAQAKAIVAFEESLATKQMDRTTMRDPAITYNKRSLATLKGMMPSFDMDGYLAGHHYAAFDSIVVGQVEYFPHVESMMRSTSLADWKSYLLWKALDHYAGMLSDEYVQANFDFYGTVLSGTKEMKPRWKRGINELTRNTISEQLGKAFVEKHFSPTAKEKVNTMVDNLMLAFKDRLAELEWMSDSTKEQAKHKLASFGRKLGFPDVWKDFSTLTITADSYIANRRACNAFDVKENVEKLGQPVDNDEWGMPAHMVNAYYHPLFNEIAFPAGIMQAPFFDENADDATNYGGIGMVIGHEFTHGFDDQGSQFDAEGNFKNWWQPEDMTKFKERTGNLGATFDNFCPFDGVCVNSQLTMGENIADLGGITLAYYAYTKTEEFKKGEKLFDYTPAQRYFIAIGQLWKIKYTDEAIKQQIATNPHSPGMFRVNGPMKNCPEFFAAFDVKEGDVMRNKEGTVARIW
jgi:putative endopeptidase